MNENSTIDYDDEILIEFLDESFDELEEVANQFVQLEKNPQNHDPLDRVYRTVHSIKGNSPFFGLMEVKKLAHTAESLMSKLRDHSLAPNEQITSVLLRSTDELGNMLQRVRNRQPETVDYENLKQLLRQLAELTSGKSEDENRLIGITRVIEEIRGHAELSEIDALSVLLEKLEQQLPHKSSLAIEKKTGAKTEKQEATVTKNLTVDDNEKNQSEEDKEEAGKSKAKNADKTMRIRENAIDGFLEHVGELVSITEAYEHMRVRSENLGYKEIALDLRRSNEVFQNVSSKLQKAVLDVRRVRMSHILKKVNRVIRDAANAKNKEVELSIIGEDLLADKSIVDALEAPLVHMSRNAVDHGIELPEDREALGKARKGKVDISVTEDSDTIVLTIKDDGAGLNIEALEEKGRSLGLLSDEIPADQDTIINILFAPGVSTASTITDISGRGVGMDVAKNNIDEMNGKVVVTSENGKGTCFVVTIPKTITTNIIDGFIVRNDGEFYIVPVEKVEMSLPLANQKTSILGRSTELVEYRGNSIPMIRMTGLCHTENAKVSEDTGDHICVVISSETGPFALIVQEVVGVKKVVLKNMIGIEIENDLFQGVAEMGDRSLALMLNVTKINESYEKENMSG